MIYKQIVCSVTAKLLKPQDGTLFFACVKTGRSGT